MQHRDSSRALIVCFALAAIVASAAVAAPVVAQGVVSGRISIQERPGETTNDFGSTVIYLVPHDTASLPMRPARSTIAMNGRAFVPRVRVVTPGSRVQFPNQDPFSHNIFSSTTGATFDLGLYDGGKAKDAPAFRRPGAYPIYCNIHPRMTAFVVVAPSPWFTQAGNDGRWSIADVPPGRYTLHAWHERTNPVSTVIEVGAGGLADLAPTLDARPFKFAQHKNKFGKEYDKTSAVRY